jgi:hypothetical protein
VKLTDFFERIAFLWPWLLVAAGVAGGHGAAAPLHGVR